MDLKYFNEIEEKYNLNSLNYRGFNYWTYNRNMILMDYSIQIDKIDEAHYVPFNNCSRKTLLLCKRIVNAIFHGHIGKRKCDVMIYRHPRKVMVDGIYKCIYTDEISKKLNNTVCIEATFHGEHSIPSDFSNTIFTDGLDIKIQLFSVYFTILRKNEFENLKKTIQQNVQEVICLLNKHYNVVVDIDSIILNMAYSYVMYYIMYHYFKKVIYKLSPKIIVEVVSYSMECMVINEIANTMNIPTVELQHGTIGSEHFAYNYPRGVEIRQFPEYIFLFSDFWKKETTFPIDEKHLISVGFPYLDEYFLKYKKNNNISDRVNILFLSCGPIAKKLEKIVVELYQKIDKKKYHIIYKLHPGEFAEWKYRYELLSQIDEIEVVADNSKNLYDLFSISSIAVNGFSSTTIFEGLRFGLKTYVFDYGNGKTIDLLCKDGYIQYFTDSDELLFMIQDYMVSSGKLLTNREKSEFWKTDAVNNIQNELERIMKECRTS